MNANPSIPGHCSRADAQPGLGVMGLGGLFVWEGALNPSCVALVWPPSGAAKGWASLLLFHFRNVTESPMTHNYNGRHFQPRA